MQLNIIKLKKNEDRRIRAGHPWIFSNEIDVSQTPLKSFASGELVLVESYDNKKLGIAYINPKSLIAARLLTKDIKANIDADFFAEKIKTALQLREQLFAKPFYRLIFSEADFLPGVIVDRFDKHFVVQINTAGMENLTPFFVEGLRQIFPHLESILLRNDSSIRIQEGLLSEIKVAFGNPPGICNVIENDIQFSAPLLTGQKTGWFYDHRMNRLRLKNYVQHKKVLDVFSYLGGFGIDAAVFGANSVDCIDASEKACEFIQKNAQKNNVSEKINVITDDAFDALKDLLNQNLKYDVIIIDPPAFVKKNKDREAGLKAYRRINELGLQLLNPNGILVSCSCSMHVSLDDLKLILTRAAKTTDSQLQIIEIGHQGPDHPLHLHIPELNYLKAIFVRKIR